MEIAKKLKIRDELLEAILFSYAANQKLAEKLILQGGGALHFIYGSPRYSSDLDFVSEYFCIDPHSIKEEIKKGIDFRNSKLTPKLKQEGSKFLRGSYSLGENKPATKSEIYCQTSLDNSITKGKYAPLIVESPEEIYADKITATLSRMDSRESIKPTDLFDLEYLTNNLHVDCSLDLIRKKAESYNEDILLNDTYIKETVKFINNPENHAGFIKSLKRTLLPDVSESMKFDAEYFDKISEHFRQYLGRLNKY